MKILICGDRNWNDYNLIKKALAGYLTVTAVIEGEARGADTLGRLAAEELGISVEKFPADWKKHGRTAGHKGKPDLVLAFHDDIEHSKGTRDMVTRARKNNIPTEVISH